MRIAVGFDHRGVKLRDALLSHLTVHGHEIVDVGTTTSARRVDFPDKAAEVGSLIAQGEAKRGVLVCGSGVGCAIAACKIPGVRAAVCHDAYSARQGVEHDDMNVLCLGAAIVGDALAAELVDTFLGASFQRTERYVRRLEKIAQLEERRESPNGG